MLLSAYRQGVFPWFNPRDPILWWNPDPRFVLVPDEVHVSSSMRRVLNRGELLVRADTDFAAVITSCARTPRPGQDGTWITEEMAEGYLRLHELGFAHSVETWLDDALVGGLYGVSIGRMFFGESMFSHSANSSKVALIRLARFLEHYGFTLIDAQLHTPHVESMGGREIPRTEFLSVLRSSIDYPTMRGSWSERFEAFTYQRQ